MNWVGRDPDVTKNTNDSGAPEWSHLCIQAHISHTVRERDDEGTTVMTSSMRVLMTMCALGCAAAACSGAETPDSSVGEEDITASIRLQPAESPADLTEAVAAAADESGVGLKVETFRFEPARGKDPSRVIAALRSKLTHAKLRVDQGTVDAAGLQATLDEYQVTDPGQQSAIAAAIQAAVGETATTRKLWLRSDDVPGADAEWAEVVLLFVSPEKGTAVRLTVRYEA